MSYILDALKKVERDRQIAQVPNLATLHRPPPAAPSRRWVWIVAALVVLNAAALAWFLRPATTPPEPAVGAVASASPSAARPARPAAAVEPPSQVPPPSAKLAQPPGAVPPPPAVTPPPAAPSKAQPPAGQAPAVQRPAPPGDAKTVAAPAQGVPPALADIVSRLQLQAVVYSETPTERLVFINNRKYVEGQMIEGQVRLERITADSAILSYEGTRFTLSRQ